MDADGSSMQVYEITLTILRAAAHPAATRDAARNEDKQHGIKQPGKQRNHT